MLERKLKRTNSNVALAAMSVFSMLVLGACGIKHGAGNSGGSNQGSIDLDAVKVGMPESTFTDAKITFAPDPQAPINGKYSSRRPNAQKGSYEVKCKDGRCFWLRVKYPEKESISKEEGLAALKLLIPGDAPPESKVDDSANPLVLFDYGNKCTGVVEYTDKDDTKVSEVSAFDIPIDQARKGLMGMGKIKTAASIAAAKKATKAAKAAKKGRAADATSSADTTTTSTATTP